MKNYKLYFLSATVWLSLAFLAIACGHSGGSGASSTTCVNGLCSSGSGSSGGTYGNPPFPSQYNGVISDSKHFSNINLALNGYLSSYGCYGSFLLNGFTAPTAPNPGIETVMTYGCKNLQIAVAPYSTTANADGSIPTVLYITSPSISADTAQSAQLPFTALNPYYSVATIGNWYVVTGGYVLQIDSQVCSNNTCQVLPVVELDVTGSTSSPTMTYQLQYLSGANQYIVASGTMVKGVDYQ